VDFRQISVAELARQVRAKELAAREVTAAALARIAALDPEIGAFTAVDGDRAIEQAAAVDQIVAVGGDPGPLAGVPIGVKDLEDAAGYVTTQCSSVTEGTPAARADSPLVARLRTAGCVVVGKTNSSEFGWAAMADNALFGATVNPWDRTRTPGGSSGGSAAAIAAGLVPLATGSDGGGSIRIPSSCCGLSGMKASHGRVPGGGPEPPGWLDLSTKGPMARRMADVIVALDAVVGPEPTDLRSLPRPEAQWRAVLDDPHVPVKVGWSPTLGYAPLDDEVRTVCERAVGVLESLGAEVVPIDTVFAVDPIGSWLTIVSACLFRTFEPHIGRPPYARVHPGLAGMVEYGRTIPASRLLNAIDDCHRLNVELVGLFHGVRLLLTPTLAAPPPPLDVAPAGLINGRPDDNWVRFTYPFNMTRSPAATVCAGLTPGGLPVGLQLIGPPHADLVVLRSAAALETALAFSELAPFGR